jgi:uncharacterized protein (DUF1800 family)
MTVSFDRAAIRFGFGLPSALSPEAMLAALAGPDQAIASWPGTTLAEVWDIYALHHKAKRKKDETGVKEAQTRSLDQALIGARATFARAVGSPDALRERLVSFWSDHFTTKPRNRLDSALPGVCADEAIRPHVNGRFPDMLRAVITHPAMLSALDQDVSVGPTSRKAKRGRKGLNENLARELLELHTLGVGAAYSQADVRQLAELLTGLTFLPGDGFLFDPASAEPGAETVLGVSYGPEGLDPVLAALDDLAARPETVAHLARKLAVHFISDTPDPDLVAALEGRWAETGGDLLAVTEVLLTHPLSLAEPAQKARQPFDLLVAGFRALGITADAIQGLDRKGLQRQILAPLNAMGQPFRRPRGPDGWPEAEAFWITPQGLAARIDWAMRAPSRIVDPLPDPRDFLRTALGSEAGERLTWAVAAAESAVDGVGLVLASPEFNRR